jgi:cytosine/creatinine deaminase
MVNSAAAILDNVLLADGRHTRIRLDGATIVAIDDATTPLPYVGIPRLDLGGALLLPGLFDGHLHLDKTVMGLPWMPHAAEPTRMSRIETDHKTFPFLALSTEQRAINLIRRCAGHGSAHLRSHVDIDTVAQLKTLRAFSRHGSVARPMPTYSSSPFPKAA